MDGAKTSVNAGVTAPFLEVGVSAKFKKLLSPRRVVVPASATAVKLDV